MSRSTPPAEDPGAASVDPPPDMHPGPGNGDHAGSGMHRDTGQDQTAGPGNVTAPDAGAERAPDAGAERTPDAGPERTPDAGAGLQGAAGPDADPGRVAAPGHGPQPGHAPQSGYAVQPADGYGPPGPGRADPVSPPRRRWRIWLGIIAGFMVLAVAIAGVSVYLLNKNKSQKWTLTAPPTLVGMSPDTSPADQLGFNALIAKFKSDLTRLPHYGSLKSTVSGLYRLSQQHAVGFIGFNGTFNVRVALRTGAGLTVTKANPGRHGGTAECGSDGINTVCQWSTGTTVGVVVVIPVSLGAGPERRRDAHYLMLKIRNSVERPVR